MLWVYTNRWNLVYLCKCHRLVDVNLIAAETCLSGHEVCVCVCFIPAVYFTAVDLTHITHLVYCRPRRNVSLLNWYKFVSLYLSL